jgi:hypothetical protein
VSTKQNTTDSNYLRAFHDGLLSGSLNKIDASGLPQGLVGICEDAVPPINYVNERQRED